MDWASQIRRGPFDDPAGTTSVPGGRYNALRQNLQGAIDNSSGAEKHTLGELRGRLDQAFHSSISPEQSAELKQLETQYANYHTLTNRTPTGTDTLTPKDVSAAVAKNFGNSAVNENRGTLAPWARNAARVMTEFPKHDPADVGTPLTRLTGSVLGGMVGAGAGHLTHYNPVDTGIVGAILGGGHGGLGDLVQVLKNGTGRVAANPLAQKVIGNQMWMPGPHTNADPAAIARLLATPPVEQLSGKTK